MQPSKPLLIGITGNIGSGKSLVSCFIQAEGYSLISADEIAKAQLDEPDLQVHLAEIWGANLLIQGRIDRKALADIVFSSPEKLRYLNSLIHPRVLRHFTTIVQESSETILFFEIPLLFEAGLESCFDAVVLVTAPLEQVLERLLKRDGSSPEHTLARLKAQMPDSEKLERVDHILQNEASPEDLRQKTLHLLPLLQQIQPRSKMAFSEAYEHHIMLLNNK